MNLSFVFCPSIYFSTLNVYKNLKTLALKGAKKFVTENLLGEKKNGQIRGMNAKQQHADSLLQNTTSHTQYLYQISKS